MQHQFHQVTSAHQVSVECQQSDLVVTLSEHRVSCKHLWSDSMDTQSTLDGHSTDPSRTLNVTRRSLEEHSDEELHTIKPRARACYKIDGRNALAVYDMMINELLSFTLFIIQTK